MIGICILLCFGYENVLLFLYKENSPKYPTLYFDKDRAVALGALSKKLLTSSCTGRFRVHSFFGPIKFTSFIGDPSPELKRHIKQTLMRHHLDEVRVFSQHSVVQYGHYSGRTWYLYFSSDGGGLLEETCRPESVRKLTNGWFFGKW